MAQRFETKTEAEKKIAELGLTTHSAVYESGHYKAVTRLVKGWYIFNNAAHSRGFI